MSERLTCYAATTPEVKKLNAFCEPRGIFLDSHNEFIVEVKELPEVFSKLNLIGYEDPKEGKWMLSNICDEGITFIINNIAPDASIPQATIFIPKENIICIHSLTEEFINGLKVKRQL